MKKLSIFAFVLFFIGTVSAQIRVNPTGVNVNSQNPTTVFLTFGQIPSGYVSTEAVWCGELVPATLPAIGRQCRADTTYGALPLRYDLAKTSGNGGLTDIMAIPSAVVRRAYDAARNGESAGFFYVRRFVSSSGQPDQFVAVTCRLTNGGARVPFALTDVELKTQNNGPVLFLKSGAKLPKITAEIRYNGTGRLKGRWEIVQPGEEPPNEKDLLTEATLPIEERGSQKRYTQIARFNHFLPPNGKFQLPLEISERLPLKIEGQYILLLRIEASDDKESDSDLQILGVGGGIVHSGAVASFPIPALKFFVGGENSKMSWEETALLFPKESVIKNQSFVFNWKNLEGATAYRLEILGGQEKTLLSAILLSPTTTYLLPPWFWERFSKKNLRWRMTAFDASSKIIGQTKAQIL